VAFAPAEGEQSTLWALDFGAVTTLDPRTLESRQDAVGERLSAWARYPAGVAWALLSDGRPIRGLDAVFASDVPRGAGLSSSASVELAFAAAWQAAAEWSLAPMELALLCQRAENQYVGVKCGIMDQATSACGEQGRVLLIDCRSLQIRALPLPADVAIIVADTGVRHSLAGSAYNTRRAACEQAVRLLREYLPAITALRDVDLETYDRLANRLPRAIEMRARHVVEEIDRTHRAVSLLEKGDMPAFGELMNACHASLRDLYEVSCPELDALAAIAQSLDGCYGARLTGAGFGGCTVNLVEGSRVDDFVPALGAAYASKTGRLAEVYVCVPSAGANILQRRVAA
jgi:galactokinase